LINKVQELKQLPLPELEKNIFSVVSSKHIPGDGRDQEQKSRNPEMTTAASGGSGGGGIRRGAFVDTRGVRWDPNDADYEGILFKQSRWMKGLDLVEIHCHNKSLQNGEVDILF
jgi:hypothetical protein